MCNCNEIKQAHFSLNCLQTALCSKYLALFLTHVCLSGSATEQSIPFLLLAMGALKPIGQLPPSFLIQMLDLKYYIPISFVEGEGCRTEGRIPVNSSGCVPNERLQGSCYLQGLGRSSVVGGGP